MYPDWQGYKFYFFADEQNGDVMNDSIYQRKTKIEEQLDVVITNVNGGTISDVVNKLKPIVLAGDDTYQQVLLHCISGVSELPAGGYLYNLDELPNIDIISDWLNQTQMDALRLGKNTYYAINDYMIPCPYVVFFNKEMIENLGMDNPYQLVYDGKWTLDRFCEMATSVVSDINGDGEMTYDDQYGVSCNETSKYISFMTASNQFITGKNSDGRIELALNTEKTVDIVNKFASMQSANVFYIPKSMEEDTQLTINSGRLLFRLDAVTSAENMRDHEVDFGFLPYPKYDEAQETYLSQDWGGLCCVPATVANPELAGAVLELLAFYSAETVIPSYYDVILTGKLARDEDTANMLDILFDTICYEVGGNYFGFSGGFTDLFYTLGRLCVEKKSSDFASWYAKNEPAAESTI